MVLETPLLISCVWTGYKLGDGFFYGYVDCDEIILGTEIRKAKAIFK
jgi:hypothetical protein